MAGATVENNENEIGSRDASQYANNTTLKNNGQQDTDPQQYNKSGNYRSIIHHFFN